MGALKRFKKGLMQGLVKKRGLPKNILHKANRNIYNISSVGQFNLSAVETKIEGEQVDGKESETNISSDEPAEDSKSLPPDVREGR